MAAISRRIVNFSPLISKPCKLIKWKVLSGSRMTFGTILLIYESLNSDNVSSGQQLKLKAQTEGTVQALIAREGDIITPGCELLELQSCLHSVVMKDLCAECGADLRELGGDRLAQVVADTSVSMIHSVPELRVSQAQAKKLGEADEQRLLKSRKLALLVDLDQTLIHTTNENVPPDMKGVFHFQLYGSRSPWYHTKFRPGTQAFLEKISCLYELHIFTFGARPYAHHIASLLDPKGCFFSHRILSRDECQNASSKSGNLKALFPCGDSMVCIIDDREDVWNFAPNVVQVKAYHFFMGTGDINSPAGVQSVDIPSQTHKYPQPNSNDEQKIKGSSDGEGKIEPGEDTVDKNTEIKNSQSNGSDGNSSSDCKSSTKKFESTSGSSCDSRSSVELLENSPADTHNSDTKNTIKIPLNGHNDDAESLINTAKEDNNNYEKSVIIIDDSPLKSSGEKLDETISSMSSSLPESVIEDLSEEDDYLMYLEEILTTVHQAFYDMHDQLQVQGEKIPDLKSVIPYVRRKVLKGLNIVFSGVIPTTCNPEKSKMWCLAKAFGANVTLDVVGPDHPQGPTTHVIAARLGTAKVNKVKKMKGVHIINPEWLTCCTERWEKVDERLFPLTEEDILRKQPRMHDHRDKLSMDFPPNVTYTGHALRIMESSSEPCPVYDPVTGKRVRLVTGQKQISVPVVHVKNMRRSKKGNYQHKMNTPDTFSNSLSPLLSFSSNEIEAMGREVDDACSEDSDNEEGSRDSEGYPRVVKDATSSSENSLEGGHRPKGWKKRKKNKDDSEDVVVVEEFGGVLDSEDETGESKFPRNEILVDSDRSNDSDSDSDYMNQSIGSVDEEMAAAVEREFLGS